MLFFIIFKYNEKGVNYYIRKQKQTKILQYLNKFRQLLKMINYLCKLIINLKCCYYITLECINYYLYHFNTGYNSVQISQYFLRTFF